MNDRHRYRIYLEAFGEYANEKTLQMLYLGHDGNLYWKGSDIALQGTVEFCTGLSDKQGKLIYEGDVIKNIQADENEVFWWMYGWHYKNYHAGALDLYSDNEHSEIIGNIHEEEKDDATE